MSNRAPIVASALSGFVVGILVTLLFSAVPSAGGRPTPIPATLPPATPVADAAMYAKVRQMVVKQLGTLYPDAKIPRLVSLQLLPVGPGLLPPGGPTEQEARKLRSVVIRFRLNDHPLGKTWRLRAAKADVFGVLKALYTSQLPIYSVELIGMFPLKDKGATKLQEAVVAYLDYDTANSIPWKRWGRDKEGQLWSQLPYKYVAPAFA